MQSLAGIAIWWWAIGIVIVALLLLVLGRLSSRTSIVDHIPPDTGPDLKAVEKGQEPDIGPENSSQPPPAAN